MTASASSPIGPYWPALSAIGLSEEAREARRHSIGGSDANIILSGSDEKVLRLWQEKRGEAEPEDLTGNLAVMLGSWSEAFNRQWYERDSGLAVSRVGISITSEQQPWRTCTLDGYVDALAAVWEAKHTNAFTSAEDALARWMPQLQHNMAVIGCERAVLSVIFGNAKWEVFEIAADWLYQDELLEAEQRFWDCVLTGEPPVALPPPPPPRPVGHREVSLEGSNAWAAAAADWIANRAAAATHKAATAALKELVEADVTRAFGHGIEAKRSKAGALSIRELGQ
ncbi:YqaJ viral recombinase family protein [Tsuneonella amylolytica]|uniref:YqaJ viral recombinase family protein n=1 Tax=Tsuneonella amylolytica TaxID=2338327 RepID=UPI0013C419EF|nr:YqaJ viral recombinase family protein [Tsuneonella amylolytica]